VKRNILEVARAVFSEKGLSGARVDEIAARTATSKRMIYYYFEDKRGLYLAVLEDTYARIRSVEATLDLEKSEPREAMAKLAAFTFDYHADDMPHVRLVMVENIHHGRHLKRSSMLDKLNLPIVDLIQDVYRRGVAAGLFRDDLDPMSIHMTMTALAFYNVSNRDTILKAFGHDMADPTNRARRREHVVQTVLGFVELPPSRITS